MKGYGNRSRSLIHTLCISVWNKCPRAASSIPAHAWEAAIINSVSKMKEIV